MVCGNELGIRRHSGTEFIIVLAGLPSAGLNIIIIIIAVEMLGPINGSASDFLSALAKKISQCSGDERETAFLFQRISVLMQRYNSILLHDSFIHEDCPE